MTGMSTRIGHRVGVLALSLALSLAGAPAVFARDQPQGTRPVQYEASPAAQAAVVAWLRAEALAPESVAMVALPVGGGAALIAHNASTPMNPASTMKLLTSYAALSTLGPDYRWRTGAFLRGRLHDGVLDGDLVLRGGGDPKLVIEDLAQFVARMRGAGLHELRGDLVIDDSVFDVGEASVESFDGDPTQPYNVRPFGLLMNFKATRVVVRPDEAGVRVELDPALDGVEVENRLRVVRGGCRAGATALTVREAQAGADRSPAATGALDARTVPRIVVSGSYAPACGERGVFASVLGHREFVHAIFRAAWIGAGGKWDGRTRIERGAAQGQPWLEWESPRTLAEVVADVNKFSNNVMSRHLLLQLAGQGGARPATPESARAALRAWLSAQGLELPGLVVENGAGLSRIERISADGLARVLLHAAAGPFADTLRESLPVVGVDGTMKHRMNGEAVAGRAWIKTGSLAEVRTIAGYVDAASGRRYAVALFYNGPRVDAAPPLQERFLRWVHANG